MAVTLWCSKCQELRNTRSNHFVVEEDGKKVVYKNFHCEVCNLFLNGERIETNEEIEK